uniref:Uncharacterized protein n=1 Tax=Mola mola TaxID=94237 RepID=A0A3Q3XDY4_MOLML
MCTLVDSGEIIILSDDEEDCEQDISCCESSVSIVEVEDVKKIGNDCTRHISLDEDLVVTFSRRAEVLPHARYDCPIHPFTATDCDTGAPVACNQLICDQCFCYICDKLASSCVMWSQIGMCHCNSHKRSSFWNNLRKCTLLGGLSTFNLTLSEIDVHLRRAGTHSDAHLYTPVYELVSTFLNEADKQDNRAAAIMRLGAAEDFIRHFRVSGLCVRPWDDILLVSVLKGQNVSGVRKDKGKKDVLIEEISVVLLRLEVLQQQNRYRELCRYLRVVQSDEPKSLQQTKDLIPFFMCMEGDFAYSVESLLSPGNAPASRFTPHLFLFYLRIFKTGTAPKLLVSQPALFSFRFFVPGPQEAKAIVHYILLNQNWSNLQIPRFFLEVQMFRATLEHTQFIKMATIVIFHLCLQVHPDQALLLLVTGALGLRMAHSALRPALPVLGTFKVTSCSSISLNVTISTH